MRSIFMVVLVLGSAGLAGCGGGSPPPTDPSELSPLTDEQKAEIKALDTQVEEEEKTGGM